MEIIDVNHPINNQKINKNAAKRNGNVPLTVDRFKLTPEYTAYVHPTVSQYTVKCDNWSKCMLLARWRLVRWYFDTFSYEISERGKGRRLS